MGTWHWWNTSVGVRMRGTLSVRAGRQFVDFLHCYPGTDNVGSNLSPAATFVHATLQSLRESPLLAQTFSPQLAPFQESSREYVQLILPNPTPHREVRFKWWLNPEYRQLGITLRINGSGKECDLWWGGLQLFLSRPCEATIDGPALRYHNERTVENRSIAKLLECIVRDEVQLLRWVCLGEHPSCGVPLPGVAGGLFDVAARRIFATYKPFVSLEDAREAYLHSWSGASDWVVVPHRSYKQQEAAIPTFPPSPQ